MQLLDWMKVRATKVTIWDLGLMKLGITAMVLAIAKQWPVLTELNIWVYVAAAVAALVMPVYSFYVKK